MKNQKMLIALGALVLVIAIMAGVFLMTRPETSTGGKNITITVVHGNGSE